MMRLICANFPKLIDKLENTKRDNLSYLIDFNSWLLIASFFELM